MSTQNIYDLADIWNDAGTTFTAFKMNVTDTASDAASLLFDYQVGGATKIKGTKAGETVSASSGSVNNAVYAFAGAANIGLYIGSGVIGFTLSGSANAGANDSGHLATSNGYYGWNGSAGNLGGSVADTFLYRQAAGAVSIAELASGSRATLASSTEEVTAASGATVTTSSLIPAGVTVISVLTRITTALGTGNGTSGFGIGDGSDPNRWGDQSVVTIDAVTDEADFTADPRWWTNAGRDITLTAAGGNFDGTGVIRVTAWYWEFVAPTT